MFQCMAQRQHEITGNDTFEFYRIIVWVHGANQFTELSRLFLLSLFSFKLLGHVGHKTHSFFLPTYWPGLPCWDISFTQVGEPSIKSKKVIIYLIDPFFVVCYWVLGSFQLHPGSQVFANFKMHYFWVNLWWVTSNSNAKNCRHLCIVR